jgi:hypothetical protein
LAHALSPSAALARESIVSKDKNLLLKPALLSPTVKPLIWANDRPAPRRRLPGGAVDGYGDHASVPASSIVRMELTIDSNRDTAHA